MPVNFNDIPYNELARTSDINDRMNALKSQTNTNETNITTNATNIATKANQADLDAEESSRISGDNTLNINKLDKTTYNSHVAGSSDRHFTSQVDDNSNYALSTLSAVLNLIKTTFEEHFSGTSDRHLTGQIDNNSTVGDGGTGVLNGVLENLQAQISALVLGGTETDPRLTQALIDFENTDWTSLGFKALQDFWQARIVELEKYYTDASVPPVAITNTSPTVTFDMNNGGVTPIISGPGSTVTNIFHRDSYNDISLDTTITYLNNGFTVTTTNSAGSRYAEFLPELIEGDTYNVSANSTITNSGGGIIILKVSDNSVITGSSSVLNPNYTFVVPVGGVKVRFYASSGTVSEATFTDVMIQEGSSKTDYIKGTQNLSDMLVDIRGENLFYIPDLKPRAASNKVIPIPNGVKLIGDYYAFLPFENIVSVGEVLNMSFNHDIVSGLEGRGQWRILYEDGTYSGHLNSGESLVVQKKIKSIFLYNSVSTISEVDFTEIMLNVGSLKPYVEAILIEVYAPVTLTSKDNYVVEGGKMVVDRNVRVVDPLDGVDYDWNYSESFSGYKRIKIQALSNALGFTEITAKMTKPNGKNIDVYIGLLAEQPVDSVRQLESDFELYLTVADVDSGWGSSHIPNDEQCNAFMNGWVTGDENGNLWTGTGTQTWWKRFQGIGTPLTLPTGTVVEDGTDITVVPKEKAYGDITETYKLQYDLATPVQENIDLIGDMTMPEGQAYVTVESGVRKEFVGDKWTFDASGNILINVEEGGYYNSCFDKKNSSIITAYANGRDYSNFIQSTTTGHGNQRIFVPSADVTDKIISDFNYLLVTYKTLSSENNTNVFDAQVTYKDDLINVIEVMGEKLAYQAEQLDIAEIRIDELTKTYFIEPTLLNGTTANSVTPKIRVVNGYVEGLGRVNIGTLVSGSTFIDTDNLTPVAFADFKVSSDDLSANLRVSISNDGQWKLFYNGSPTYFDLTQIRFKVGE